MHSTLLVLVIFCISIILTILLILKKPEISLEVGSQKIRLNSFYLGVSGAAILVLILGLLSGQDAVRIIMGDENLSPLGILVLFFSMVFISIFIDVCGFFEYCARLAVKAAGNDGRKLFIFLYLVISLLTIFTSNDVLILTFTPFVYYFSKHAKIDPKPYLFAEFFAANTWSMLLLVGNPTNILIGGAQGITFFEYLGVMALPTITAGLSNLILIYILFHKSINVRIENTNINPEGAIKDRIGAVVGVAILAACIVTLSLAPYLGWSMWLVSLCFAMLLAVFITYRILHRLIIALIQKKRFTITSLRSAAAKMPWGIIPFLLSLFILIGALETHGVVTVIGNLLNRIAHGDDALFVIIYGFTSTILANVINNIPMSVLYTKIILSVPQSAQLHVAFASIIGSNLGALLTPIGALAGIMWMSILKDYGMRIDFLEFSKNGVLVTAVSLSASLAVLIWIL